MAALAKQRGWEVFGFTSNELDVGDRAAISSALIPIAPALIINCAAYTDVDGCETRRYEAERVNRDAPAFISWTAANLGALVVHFSTDFIFDGSLSRAYVEGDEPNPLSYYGRTKLLGESAVRRIAPDHLVIRTSWVYGHGRRNFVSAIAGQLLGGKPLRVVSDQIGSPTYARDLAEATLTLIDRSARGLVHVSNSGECSRFEYASEIARLLGRDPGPVLEPIQSESLSQPARRPAHSTLDCSRYSSITSRTMRPWQEALRSYLAAESPDRLAH